jgi:DNA-binding protein HU-beta
MAWPLPRYTTGDEIGGKDFSSTRSLTHITSAIFRDGRQRELFGCCRLQVWVDCSNPIRSSMVSHELRESRHASREGSPAAKKSAATAKSGIQATITLKRRAAALSDSHDVPKKQAEAVLGDLVTLTTRHLKKGAKIRLTGLGILQVRKRAARMGRNPATGEAIKIKASKKIAFRAAKELKEAV